MSFIFDPRFRKALLTSKSDVDEEKRRSYSAIIFTHYTSGKWQASSTAG